MRWPVPAFSAIDRERLDARRTRAVFVVALALLLYGAMLVPIADFVTDDTYIHLQYAKHFRDGQGLVFNTGERVYGTTSPLWSMGLGLIGRTGVDLLLLCKVLSMLFGALSIVAGSVALRRFVDAWVSGHGYGARRAELAWALGTLAFSVDAWLVRWSASGMETSFATFLVAGGFAAYFGQRPWGSRASIPASWWFLASLVRPEVILLPILLGLRIFLSRSRPAVRFSRAIGVTLVGLLVLGPWLVYAFLFYGTVLPATLAAKAAGGQGPSVFAALVLRQLQAVAATRGVEIVALLALLPLLGPRLWERRAEHFVPLVWLVGLPLLYALRGVYTISRYLVPVGPLVICYAWASMAWFASRARTRPTVAVASLVSVAVLAIGLNLFTFGRYVVPQARLFTAGVSGTLASFASWCRENTPPDAQFAIPDIGAFGYLSERPVVDLAGLVTPSITPLLSRYPYDELVTGLHFEGVARPEFLIDRADRPRRMLFESPYAACLTVILTGRVDQRGISHPEPAYYTLYKIDWDAFDRMAEGERQAMR